MPTMAPSNCGGASTGQLLTTLPKAARQAVREEMRQALNDTGGPIAIEVETGSPVGDDNASRRMSIYTATKMRNDQNEYPPLAGIWSPPRSVPIASLSKCRGGSRLLYIAGQVGAHKDGIYRKGSKRRPKGVLGMPSPRSSPMPAWELRIWSRSPLLPDPCSGHCGRRRGAGQTFGRTTDPHRPR